MRRVQRCVAQTINLSNPKTCMKPNLIQKLVGQEEPCPSVGEESSSYWTPRPVKIRICGRRDIERTCSPKLCDCPQRAPPKTKSQRLCGALMFLVKGAIAAGLVYWTYSEGFWGDGEQSEELYYRIVSTLAPVLPNPPDVNDIELPHLESIKYKVLEGYNHAVAKIIDVLITTPSKVHKKVCEIIFPVEETENEATDQQRRL